MAVGPEILLLISTDSKFIHNKRTTTTTYENFGKGLDHEIQAYCGIGNGFHRNATGSDTLGE